MGRLRGLAWKRVARGVIGAVVGNIASAATLHIPRRAIRLSSDRLLAIVACGRPLRLQLGEDGNERIGDQLKHGHRVIFQCDVCAFLSGGASEQLADCPDGSCVVVDHSQKPPTPVFRGSRVSAAASMPRPPANLALLAAALRGASQSAKKAQPCRLRCRGATDAIQFDGRVRNLLGGQLTREHLADCARGDFAS